jgi:hypothetical protein
VTRDRRRSQNSGVRRPRVAAVLSGEAVVQDSQTAAG